MLNSKTRELIALQEEAQAKLAETRRSFADGMKIAKEVKADLDYVHRKVRYASRLQPASFTDTDLYVSRVLKQKTERRWVFRLFPLFDDVPLVDDLPSGIQLNTIWLEIGSLRRPDGLFSSILFLQVFSWL